jgi:hypothetical protein
MEVLFGNDINLSPGLILGIGGLLVIYIGVGLIRSKVESCDGKEVNQPLWKIVGYAFIVTQRKKRISFYCRNGIFDTGCRLIDAGETYSVLASDMDYFDSKEYEMLLSRFSFGTYKKHIT